jgi:Putative sensor
MLAPEVNTRPDRWPPFGFGDVGTYRRSIYLLADLVVGPTLFALGTSLLLLSAGFAVTLVGIPLLVVTLGLARAAGRFERARAARLLGEVVPPPPMVRGLRARVTDRAGWSALAYTVLLGPVSLVTGGLAAVGWVAAIAGVTYPVYGWAVDSGTLHVGPFTFTGLLARITMALIALGLLLVMPTVTRALSRIDAALVRRLLG